MAELACSCVVMRCFSVLGRMSNAEKKAIQAAWKREWERIQLEEREKGGSRNGTA